MFIRKNVIKLAIPIMIEQTFVMLLGVFNTMMAGHIGEEAVSAVGMVDSINNIFISVFPSNNSKSDTDILYRLWVSFGIIFDINFNESLSLLALLGRGQSYIFK